MYAGMTHSGACERTHIPPRINRDVDDFIPFRVVVQEVEREADNEKDEPRIPPTRRKTALVSRVGRPRRHKTRHGSRGVSIGRSPHRGSARGKAASVAAVAVRGHTIHAIPATSSWVRVRVRHSAMCVPVAFPYPLERFVAVDRLRHHLQKTSFVTLHTGFAR